MYRFFLLCFFCLFSLACEGKSYLCWNEEKTEALAFSYDDTFGSVTVEDLHSYYISKSKKTPLSSEMPGNSYILKMDQSFITLELIQDTVYTRGQLPSGQFIESHEDIKTEKDYLEQRRYHAVYPVVWKYVFDKKLLSLSVFTNPLPKPRSAIEQEFIYNKDTGQLNPKKTRDLTVEESADILQIEKRGYVQKYPQCENESFSFKKMMRSLLKSLLFP